MKFCIPIAVLTALSPVVIAAAHPRMQDAERRKFGGGDGPQCDQSDIACLEARRENHCHLVGEPCYKVRRKLEELEARGENHCHMTGEPCYKVRRALEEAEKRHAELEARRENHCHLVGEPCYKLKRAADEFLNAIRSAPEFVESREASFSHEPGNAGFVSKRQVHDLANILATTHENPREYYDSLGLETRFAPDSAVSVRGKPDLASSSAEKRWCPITGEPCYKNKRELEAAEKRWCPMVGEPCYKNKRDESEIRADNTWCHLQGKPCHTVKNAARAVLDVIRDVTTTNSSEEKREPVAEAACNAVGGACSVAKRDLHAINNVVRNILKE